MPQPPHLVAPRAPRPFPCCFRSGQCLADHDRSGKHHLNRPCMQMDLAGVMVMCCAMCACPTTSTELVPAPGAASHQPSPCKTLQDCMSAAAKFSLSQLRDRHVAGPSLLGSTGPWLDINMLHAAPLIVAASTSWFHTGLCTNITAHFCLIKLSMKRHSCGHASSHQPARFSISQSSWVARPYRPQRC